MRVYFYILISAILGLDPFAPIEKSLEKQLMDKIAGLESATVKFAASRFNFIFRGLCDKVIVEMRGLPTGAIKLESFRIEVDNFRFSPFYTFVRNDARVYGAKIANWTIRILDEDIQDYILDRGPLMKGITVQIEPEAVTLRRSSAIAEALNLDDPFSMSGCLILDGDKNVALDLRHVKTFGIGPERPFLRVVLKLVNPILTSSEINKILNKTEGGPLASVKLKASFENICMDSGHIDLYGTIIAEPKPKPEKRKLKEIITEKMSAIEAKLSPSEDKEEKK